MKFRTPSTIERFFYLAIDTEGDPGDERFGISLGRFYAGLYNKTICLGLLNGEGVLDD